MEKVKRNMRKNVKDSNGIPDEKNSRFCTFCGFPFVTETLDKKTFCPKCKSVFQVKSESKKTWLYYGEEWRWIAGFEEVYQISNYLRVRSIPRISCDGRKLSGRWIATYPKNQELYVNLWKDGKQKEYNLRKLYYRAFCHSAAESAEDEEVVPNFGTGEENENPLSQE